MLKIYPNHRLIFSGNHYLNSALFDFHASEIKLPVIGRIYYQLKKLLNVIFNLILYPIYKDLPLSQNTNRIYIVIKL